MQQRKGVRLGPTPGRNRNASNRPGQQSTILQNEHSQHLPNGLHEEHVKATASCCAPVTWTFSALEYLSLSSTTSQSTHHRECRGNSFRKLTWQHKELIIFPPPPPNTCTKKRCFEWFLSPEERQCCTFAEQIHLPHACISARAIHVISLQNSKHVTSTKKTSCKTLRGDEISSRLFTCSHSHTLYRISSSPEMLL